MSEIRATTISDTAGTGPVTLTKQSAAKVWSNTEQAASYSIRDSLNLSSVTDNGTGDTGYTFTSSFSSANHAVSGTASNENNNFGNASNLTVQTASTLRARSYDLSNYTQDAAYLTMCVNGDLA